MQIRSPFLYLVRVIHLPSTCVDAIRYRMCNASSEGSLGSKMMAVYHLFSKMSVNTVLVILTLASVNHFISASAILKSTTLSCWYQVKFSEAILSQNFLGSLIFIMFEVFF
jgi:hypothetical protein